MSKIIFLSHKEMKPFVQLVENAILFFFPQSGLVKIICGLALGGSKVGRFRISWEHALVWTRPRSLVYLFDR